ncbi:ankyrin repeat domain-containing protein [Duganella vulcania]|uniref:Ankyrin repeat domain-containing protein n=1 Tax=Duganella vulcania TaxID=2692166 RepID=A0A845GHT7_9BURK|nr:ankyrin repeat domain-containing protein [Duganella vulcania]MYM92327.1 hypothetical protein [Duganella vulcania]
MATIPTFEELLLEVHQSLGLKFEQKDKNKLSRLEKPLADHLERVDALLGEIFTALGLEGMARFKAMDDVLEWSAFDKSVELDTWTYVADRRQILWHLFGHSYAPALGRRLAFWTLHERLDTGMPGGRFWFLPGAREDAGARRLIMPVAQVVDWLRDLLGAPMEQARVGLGGKAAQERQQRIDDARKDIDVYASMARELDNWRQGRLPHASTIEKYFPDDAKLEFKGTLRPTPDLPLPERLQGAINFVKAKGLDAEALRDEIPITEVGRLEAILAYQASDADAQRFVELTEERWSAPSMATIRRRLIIARMVQDGYRRLGRFLLGEDFDEHCADPVRNKVLQLVELFKVGYNLTIQAAKESDDPQEQDVWFDSRLTPWDKEGIFLAIAPSRRETGARELSELLSRAFAAMHPGGPLDDLVGHDEASAKCIAERELRRIIACEKEREAVQSCIASLAWGSPFRKLQQQTEYWVVYQVAPSPELPVRIREMACVRARELARTPSEALGAIVLHLHALFHCDRADRPKEMRQQVEQLLALAESNPAYGEWGAVLLNYKAKHHLAINEFEAARESFNAALQACHARSYGPVRGEIARDAFALLVERPPVGFSLGNYEGYMRNMLAFGALSLDDERKLPTLEDTACVVSEYFWENQYAPYPGEPVEEPLARKHTEAIIGTDTMEIILRADWDGLDAWMGRNADLRDKRLRHVRGETVLMTWLGGLYQCRTTKHLHPQIGPIEEVAPIANALERNLREAALRVVKKWPKLINLADFKKQTPLLLAARNGDAAMVAVLLEAGADAEWLDVRGNSAMDLALASGISLCVDALSYWKRGIIQEFSK